MTLRDLATLLTAALTAGLGTAAIIIALVLDTRWTLPVVTFCAGAAAGIWLGWQTRD